MSNRLSREGPPLASLLHRLADTPVDFLAEPCIRGAGQVHVDAVVGDLLTSLGVAATARDLERFAGRGTGDRNMLAVTLLLCWVLADSWFASAAPAQADLQRLLSDGASELAAATAARRFVDDPDRREELVRVTLAAIGCRPAGESEAQAEDRLTSLSAAERARVVEAARAAELRARQIREALRKRVAEESADKWTRE
ncbi:MAG TPA: hypothetical protein VGJ18_12310 [Gemmatimonadaceae bacterium]|jgi:hypothetical protein